MKYVRPPRKGTVLVTAVILLLFCWLLPFRSLAAQDAPAKTTVTITPKDILKTRGKNVPILMYHSILEEGVRVTNSMEVSVKTFRAHMTLLKQEEYHPILYSDLYAYVTKGKALPSKPVIITFDDGYRNNLTLAAPILRELGFKAEISVIGCSIGKSIYKDTGTPIVPHFTLEEARPWVREGVIHLISHSYDMHQLPNLDGPRCRSGALPFSGESEASFLSVFQSDYMANRLLLGQEIGDPQVFTYPYGYCNTLTEKALTELNVPISVTMDPGIARVIANVPSTLRRLPRQMITNSVTSRRLLNLLGAEAAGSPSALLVSSAPVKKGE